MPKKLPNRQSIRLKNYDYSENGAYFITLCAQNRKKLFGRIIDGKMILNEFGKLAHDEWQKTSEIRENIILDEFMIMPDHLHGIIIIENPINSSRLPSSSSTGVWQYAPTKAQQ